MQATINHQTIEIYEGETILAAARRTGHFIPTLCEFAAMDHHPGTCRVCLVEATDKDGNTRITTSCDTLIEDGMTVMTRTRRVRDMQRLNVELIFADHRQDCVGCDRHGDCELQKVGLYVGMAPSRLTGAYIGNRVDDACGSALTFHADRCIRCLRCIEVCRQVQGIGTLTLNGTGVDSSAGYGAKTRFAESDRCIQCGQCTLVCPTGALSTKDHAEKVIDWLEDPEIVTVFQMAPATRIVIADEFDLPKNGNHEGLIVAALKRLGADYVCDTRFAADVTIMEEGTEVLDRLLAFKRGEKVELPVFTSCCPGWVNYVEKTAPDLIGHLSSTRSPQGIFSSLAKHILPEKLGIAPEKLKVVSLMPCTAKKDEAGREQLEGETDAVLTVRELARLFKRYGFDLKHFAPEPFDAPFMTQASGAAQLFGTTGGVMEAALRTLYALTNPKASERDAAMPGGDVEARDTTRPTMPRVRFNPVRGLFNVKEARVDLGEAGEVKVAVVHGIANLAPLLAEVRAGTSPYGFIEVMSCPGGCIGGGGTSRGEASWKKPLEERQSTVYAVDDAMPVGASFENPQVVELYKEVLGEPGGKLAHEWLHTHYADRKKTHEKPAVQMLFKRLQLAQDD